MLKTIEKLKLTNKEKKAIVKYRDRILQGMKDKVLLLRLYGSKVSGDSRRWSDIDILVVLKDENKETEDAIIKAECEIMDRYNLDISSVSFGLREFRRLNKLKTNFMLNVQEEGINLWQSKEIAKNWKK